MNIHAERIASLRALMRSRDWDAVVLTGSDPHGSEYPAERYKQIRWLTGFTGEAADLVVTADHAGRWTDTRYFIQANVQLAGTGVELHKTRVPEQVLIPEWLAGKFADHEEHVIAIDGACTPASFAEEITGAFGSDGVPPYIVSAPDLINLLWTDRPGIPQTPVFTVDSGTPRSAKLEMLRAFCRERACDCILLSALDEVAWTLDVRASDIEYNPLVISYLFITQEETRWYVLKDAVEDPESRETFSTLASEGIDLLPYDDIDFLGAEFRGRLFVDPATLNYQLYNNFVSAGIPLEEGTGPVALRKAVKNPREIAGMREAHPHDIKITKEAPNYRS